ncbi:hypothetical protein RND81_05G154900 [Saponaria officinalis]|uniref:Uncharacterized protein n=1 Tax=Saponaria officinalis TaxID=3572 RepID=A0AAW1L1B3_SAPOF
MYPKVRVRCLEEDDDFERPTSPLKGFNIPTILDSSPPAKGNNQASPLVAKVPNLQIQRSITPPNVLPKAKKKSELNSDETVKIRASSIPRPRAVVSSPDNDQLLASKNRTRIERPSGLKSHNSSEGKRTPTNTVRSPLKRAGENKETARTGVAEIKKEHAIDIRVRRANIVKAKPCFSMT